MPELSDTIFGEMTCPGRAALRVVRVSGRMARKITRKLFSSSRDPWKRGRVATNGVLRTPLGSPLDSIVVIAFPGPNSYTGEDCVEFHCHGSEGVIRSVESSLSSLGARSALPGEFSYRAFLAGKLSALEGESIGKLISAETELEARAAGAAAPGPLDVKIAGLREKLVGLKAKWEARLDFPEDVPQPGLHTWKMEVSKVAIEARALSRLAERSRRVREGFRIAIFGAPNSGKSSLFNALLGRERAIVTPHPGTTRDVIEEKLDVDGIPMIFMDMAGARKKGRGIERKGIEKAMNSTLQADAVLFLFDGSRGWRPADDEAYAFLDSPPFLFLAAKKDLYGKLERRAPGRVLEISSRTGEGIDRLLKALSAWAGKSLPKEGLFLMSRRQEECLTRAVAALDETEEALGERRDELAAAEKAGEALREMDRLVLAVSEDEVYDLIFSNFCIGK